MLLLYVIRMWLAYPAILGSLVLTKWAEVISGSVKITKCGVYRHPMLGYGSKIDNEAVQWHEDNISACISYHLSRLITNSERAATPGQHETKDAEGKGVE